jgi:hypothetical protein
MSCEATSSNDFATESQFVTRFRGLLPGYLEQRGAAWRILEEVGAGRRIADVVALLTAEPDLLSRASSILSVAESVVLSVLRRFGPTRIDLLEQRCGVERGGLRDGALFRLQKWEMLGRAAGGRVTLSPESNSQLTLIAVEAKLKRWREALQQAKVYQNYADETFVALPEQYSKNAIAAKTEFERAGVGLLILSRDSIITPISSKANRQHDWRREFVVSRLLSGRA